MPSGTINFTDLPTDIHKLIFKINRQRQKALILARTYNEWIAEEAWEGYNPEYGCEEAEDKIIRYIQERCIDLSSL